MLQCVKYHRLQINCKELGVGNVHYTCSPIHNQHISRRFVY
jgi:hypothetical protein